MALRRRPVHGTPASAVGYAAFAKLFLAFPLCVAAAVQARAAGCSMALVSRLPLQPYESHLLVQASFNSKPAQLIFDTGAYSSVLTDAAVSRLGLHVMKGEEFASFRTSVRGIGGARSALGVTAHTVELGGLHARDYNFMAADFLAPPVDGLLSVDLISQFDIDLDFPEHQAVLYRPTGDCSAPAAFLASPLYMVPLLPFGDDRRPRVRVQIGDHDVVALVDTGAPTTSIFRSAAARLGVAALPAGPHVTAGGVGPRRVDAMEHVFEPVTVGDLTISNMKVAVLDDAAGTDGVEMLLGADFQQRVHLWISYSSHSLIMQYPPRPSKRAGAE